MPQTDNTEIPGRTGSLRRRVQSGGIQVIGGFGFAQFLRLLSNLVLTRLLVPEDFGLMAAAVSVSVLAVMMTDLGIQDCVVRSKNTQAPEFLWTAWTVRILRNLIVWLIVTLFAGGVLLLDAMGLTPGGSTFSDPRLPTVIALTAVQLLISSVSSVKPFLATRNMLIERNLIAELLTQIFGAAVTIVAAYHGLGVWALVLGLNATAAFNVMLSYVMYDGPSMRLCWDKRHLSEILNFGKWLILASFFGFMTNKGDHFIFGWALDQEHFGLYAIASIWIGVAFHLVEQLITKLFYPALSEVLRDRPTNLPQAYRESRLALDAFAVFIVLGVYFLSDPVFAILYPENFSGVSYYLKLLSPVVLFAPYRLLSYLALAMGETKKFTLVSFVTGLTVILFVPATIVLFGLKAGILAFSVAAGASTPVLWWITRSVVPIDWMAETRMLVAAAVAFIALYTLG